MELAEYGEKHVRVTDTDGETYTGIAEYYPAEYCLHEYGEEEAGIRIGDKSRFATKSEA